MRKWNYRENKFPLYAENRTIPCLFLLLLLWFLAAGKNGYAAEMEILTPRAGATIIARNPEIHLVLRQSGPSGAVKVKVEKNGAMFEPVVAMEGEEETFIHFRLPLEQGMNRFTVVPGKLQVEIVYQQLQAAVSLKFLGKNVYLFHQDEQLPEACQDCHDLKEAQIIEPVGLKKQTGCATCHKTIANRGAWKHGPTSNLQCLDCHQQSVKPWRIGFPMGSIDELCLSCHTGKLRWFSSKYRHGPMIGGCTLCHDPHGSDYRYQLWADGASELCIACHYDKKNLVTKKKEDRMPYVHGIIVGMGCVACHNPHAADNFFVLTKPINELCTGCHQHLAGITRGHPVDRHPLSAPRDPRRPDRQLACTGCHDPHGSSFQHLLIDTTLGGRLCRECHKK